MMSLFVPDWWGHICRADSRTVRWKSEESKPWFCLKRRKKKLHFLKIGPNSASFCLFSFFSHDKYRTNLTIKDKSIDGVLGAQTRGGRMVGPDESTELWWHPLLCITYICKMMLIGRLIVIGAFESSSQGLSIRQCYSSPVWPDKYRQMSIKVA